MHIRTTCPDSFTVL
jgi:hypothetical protein